MNTFFHLIKREYLQYKKEVIITPLLVAGITLIAFIYSTLRSSFDGGAATTGEIKLLELLFWFISKLFYLIMFWLILRYLGTCLKKDYEDRSVYFWKSMPVSDTATILSKYSFGTILLPIYIIAVFIVLQTLIIAFVAAMSNNFGFTETLSKTHAYSLWASMIVNTLPQMLWAAPLYALYLLLPSLSTGLKSSAIVIIITTVLIEKYTTLLVAGNSTAYSFREVTSRFFGGTFPSSIDFILSSYERSYSFHLNKSNFKEVMNNFFENINYPISTPYDQIELWIGLTVAIGLIHLAIYFRARRNTI